jgi:hypothetical protein
VLALVCVASLATQRASASEPRAAEARAHHRRSDADVTRRLAFLEARLREGQVGAKRWWNVWLYGWSALTLAQAGVALGTTDRGLRIDSAVGAIGSSLAVVPFGLFAFPARTAADELDRLPDTTPAERRRKLAMAEQKLDESAEAEALGRSLLNHALGAAVSAGFGLVLALGYERPASGAFNAAGGFALCEVQIWTQPTAAIEDRVAYRRWTRRADAPAPKAPAIAWSFAPRAGGLAVVGRF